MPVTLPNLDDRRYDDLLGEAIARIPVHTPEWTSFNHSDPGITLIEIFAFLTESLLYRANQIPERNRKRFLQLLRIPLQTATPAQGLITISNQAPAKDSSGPQPVVLTDGIEVRSGQVPFRTTRGLDVLPVEGRLWIKQKVGAPTPELKSYYQQLYASYRGTPAGIEPQLYEAVPFPARGGGAVSLGDTIDSCIWLALLVRDSDVKLAPKIEDVAQLIRSSIANRTLSLGVVPSAGDNTATLPAGRSFGATSSASLRVEVPNVPDSGGLPEGTADRVPEYRAIGVSAESDLFSVPGIADVSLPDAASLELWNNIDPLEAGVDALPPAIEDEAVAARVVTWLRISSSAATSAQFLWMGINAVPVTQSAQIVNELLPAGTGEPEQMVTLSRPPVLPDSVTVMVTTLQGQMDVWQEIDDLGVAGAEVPVPDPRLAPGGAKPPNGPSKVFALNAESGEVRFGDGAHGSRPPEGATLRATYEYSLGAKGNVGAATIDSAPVLPEGFKVANPIATWGGADAEAVADGEKQIARYLQHRDRLVTVFDFKTITLRTPGVEIGRVEVLPNYNPSFGGAQTPGAVTLMIIPTTDPQQPDAPQPRRDFLDTVCRYLDPRRLITTEVFLRGPDYQGLWVSIGIKVAAGFNESQITEAVQQSILAFLAPTAGGREPLPDDPALLFGADEAENGWKLGKSVVALEIAAVANRTRGVEFVLDDLLLADANGTPLARLDMTGLQLPRVLGIRVTNGPAASLDDLRGKKSGGSTQAPAIVQIPVIPEECR
ncbi:MAG TPA: baseplate J/gp47 family protein [Thermoanaerobaculia bacterium]|jgi:hypothetical protein|nr:baseplate J/gp47 family protein [Thermoanaerobaculia bacterium]